MKILPMEFEGSQASAAPAKRRTGNGDVSASVAAEIGSLKRRLATAQEAERAASMGLAKRLSDVKRLAGAAAREANLPAVWIILESEPWETYFDFLPPEGSIPVL